MKAACPMYTLIHIPNERIPYTLCLDEEGVPCRGWYMPLEYAVNAILYEGGVFEEIPWESLPLGRQIRAYFDGEKVEFDTPMHLSGTDFQKRVWEAMARIPYGEVLSYGELAHRIGCRAYRAVGQACHRNPLPLIVPCHRVIASGGRLGGFGGGEDIKRRLLAFEGVDPLPVG